DRGCCYFYGQISDVTSMSQRINLTAYANDIDNHNVTYNLSAWLGGWAGQDDSAYVSFQFLSSSLSVLGTSNQIGPVLDTDRGHTTQLIYRSTHNRDFNKVHNISEMPSKFVSNEKKIEYANILKKNVELFLSHNGKERLYIRIRTIPSRNFLFA
ncbi:unnamed protein product, partial [Didymodactylos carnosus]